MLGLLVAMGRLWVGIPTGIGWSLLGLGAVNTLADLLLLLATRSGVAAAGGGDHLDVSRRDRRAGRAFLGEQFASRQLAGLVLAAVSVGLIALG